MTEQTEPSKKIYPLLYSAIGNNAYYLDDCKIVEHRPAYAACLRKLEDHRRNIAGGLNAASCRAAMRAGTCNAQHMRQEEELAGQALYFIDRNQLSAEVIARTAAEATTYERPKTGEQRAARPAPAPAPVSAFGGDYADAINTAMRGMPPPVDIPPPPKPVAPVVNVAKAGMSMVEIAKAAALANAQL